MAKNTESIFKSPDTITGRVGVVGSGKGLTSYEAKKVKYHEKFKNELPDDLKDVEKYNQLKRSRFN